MATTNQHIPIMQQCSVPSLNVAHFITNTVYRQKKHTAKQLQGFKCKDFIRRSVFHRNRNLSSFRNVLLPIQKDSNDAHEHIMQASHELTENGLRYWHCSDHNFLLLLSVNLCCNLHLCSAQSSATHSRIIQNDSDASSMFLPNSITFQTYLAYCIVFWWLLCFLGYISASFIISIRLSSFSFPHFDKFWIHLYQQRCLENNFLLGSEKKAHNSSQTETANTWA